MKVKLRVGHVHACAVQDFESMAIIVRKAFGSQQPASNVPKNAAEAALLFNKVVGG